MFREEAYPRFDATLFSNPTPNFRSIPFWSLNDHLEPREIRRQLEAFKEGGFGGAYLHSRIGLITPYLGEDWWKAMDAGVEACDDLGIEAWFYDEDKWPSGFAGGLVPRLDEAFRARALIRLRKGRPFPEADAKVLRESGDFIYLEWRAPLGEAWFNGTSYVDLFNPKAVAAFIDSSYRPYVERYRGRSSVKGIFTDEPQISPWARRVAFEHDGIRSYSSHLRERFQADHGMDLLDRAADLFEETPDYRDTRRKFYQSVTAQFENAFTIPVATYCGENQWVWTGHYNGENSLGNVTANVGSMASHYRHMQRPGVDWLGLHTRGGLLTTRTLSSVANQTGKVRRLSEMFGCSGQNMDGEDREWIFGWHAMHGVNHSCPHLSLYSMRGVRKRDYPPTISPQQPWWPWNRAVEDTMARLSYATTVGRMDQDILVVLPLESVWAEFDGNQGPPRCAIFEELLSDLSLNHRDFDVGEEGMLAEMGAVEGGNLIMGEMKYPAMIIPQAGLLRPSTLSLAGKLLAAKGRVFIQEKDGFWMDGNLRATLESLVGEGAIRFKAVSELESHFPKKVRVHSDAPVLIQNRVVEQGRLTLAFNPSRMVTVKARLSFHEVPKQVTILDAVGGTMVSLEPAADAYEIELAPAQCVVLGLDLAGLDVQPAVKGTRSVRTLALQAPWKAHRLDPNALTLDFATWRMGGESSGPEPEPVIGIHQYFTEKNMSGELHLEFRVEVADVPKVAFLAFECPQMDGQWRINGKPLPLGAGGTFLDSCITTVPIAPLLQKGTNRIAVTLDYKAAVPTSDDSEERYGTEIESTYLIGDFAVQASPGLDKPEPLQRDKRGDLRPGTLHRYRTFTVIKEDPIAWGDLASQGYPFYAGRFSFHSEFEWGTGPSPVALKFSHPQAQVVSVMVDDIPCGSAMRSPWEIAMPEGLAPGRHTLKVTVVNSLRNLLGPHHHIDGELTMVGPESFSGKSHWTNPTQGDPDWMEKRKTGEARIWRDDYHVIGFDPGPMPEWVFRG